MDQDVSVGKTVAFIIPVRHPQNARNWPGLIARLQQTIKSISAQTNPSWCCVIVANEEADLPVLPQGFHVERVSLAPNPNYQMDHSNREAVYEAVRVDKGKRVLAGMKAARHARFFMVVDDDDFVSRDITAFAAQNPDAPGWYFDKGYVWTEGSGFLFLRSDFSKLCGTSHLIRSDLYQLPDVLDEDAMEYVKAMMGSHIKMESILAGQGAPLAPLPFVGAVYRVGHVEAHSQSRNVFRSHLLNRETIKRPRLFLSNALRFRRLDGAKKGQFGMVV
ncbi:glycosyltransferase family A protein [Rhizobium oryzicola]|uniref:Glycosyltransferase family A protein n=1 Tax=Rhizobium oryzicola TaxID=1232668 RepID=A0ABT8ST13_9HYPH|nr:glycosyltransferase family A protein [Rhizobium oryzicola]MDO1581531.1 glycosyltransferase family A protein [Rhizobium oryzicola]